MADIKYYSLDEIKNLHVYGRSPFTQQDNGSALVLFWTASGFSVESRCGELWAQIEADYSVYEPWLSVWINGCQVSRFMLLPGKNNYCLFRGLSQEKINHFALLKETQAMSSDEKHMVLINSLGVPSTFAEKKSSDEIFLPQKEKKLKIEFVGDSITTGEGLTGGVNEQDWISGWMATRDSYALNTAKNLNADFRILSQSGWGICCGWDNDINCALPPKYEFEAGLLWGERNEKLGAGKKHDFSKWQPDFIVVNLGTNDWGAFNSPEKNGFKLYLDQEKLPEKIPAQKDSEYLREKIWDFLGTLRKNNPQASIVWAYGMCGPELGDYLRQFVEEYARKNDDGKISFLMLPSMSEETEEEKGSRSHPGPGTHKRACQLLTKKIQELMK